MRRGFSRLLLGIRSLGGLLLVLVLIETTQLREILNGPDMNLQRKTNKNLLTERDHHAVKMVMSGGM